MGLVGGDGRHDVGALHRLGGAVANLDRQPAAGEVGDQPGGGGGIDVVHAQPVNAHQMLERDRLELALRAIADQRHHAAPGAGQQLRGHCRRGGGAHRRRQRQLAEQQRRAGSHVGQHAEGHHGGQAPAGVARVAVDILEAVAVAIRDRHQLDDALACMVRHAGGLVEILPAQEVGPDALGDGCDAGAQAAAADQRGDRGGAQVQRVDGRAGRGHGAAPGGDKGEWSQSRETRRQGIAAILYIFR
jgi:hypothetical protein